MTELDPIASDVGHGTPGLRDNLRPFSELVLETASQKHVFCEVRAGKLCGTPGTTLAPGPGWSIDSVPNRLGFGGAVSLNVWAFPWTETWAGVLKDVVSVVMMFGSTTQWRYRYRRCETKAELEAITDTSDNAYFFDPDVVDSGARWDDGTTWDSGALWDQVPILYCKGIAPLVGAAVAKMPFLYGSDSVAQPTLGPEKLANGDLESWASASDVNSWTEVTEGSGTVARDDGIDGVGTYSAKLGGTMAAAGLAAIQQGSLAGVAGKRYRLSGWYKTQAGIPATVYPRLNIQDGTVSIASDGRSTAAVATTFALANTDGYARRFSFDFVCPSDTAALQVTLGFYNASGGSVTAFAWVDGLSLKRIWRFERCDPRLSLESVPRLEERRPDAYFGVVARAVGALSFVNEDGHYEPLVGGLEWVTGDVLIRSGGRFVGGGNEILFEDLWVSLRGILTAQPEVDDMRAVFPFEDVRAKFSVRLPPRTVEFLGDFMNEDNGRRYPLIFGAIEHTKPLQTATLGAEYGSYGNYESHDPALIPYNLYAGGLKSYEGIWAYEDEEAAEKLDTARRIQLVIGDEFYDYGGYIGEGYVQRDVRPRRITVDNAVLDFNVGGGALAATVAPGLYHVELVPDAGAAGLCKRIADAMNTAAGTADITCTYDEVTHVFTIAKGAGTLQLLCNTGANRDRAIWSMIGFDPATDKTGALTYTGTIATFVNTQEHILRISLTGWRDDASGTYTGTASAAVQLAPDVLRWIIDAFAELEPDVLDAASFVASRASCAQQLGVYLTPPGTDGVEMHEVIEKIENGANADLVLEGGRFYLRPRTSTVPAGVVDLVERDFIAFSGGWDAEDYYQDVRILYKQNPVSGVHRSTQLRTARSRVQFGRAEQKTFETYYTSQTDAQARRDVLGAEAATKRRRFRFTVKGSLFRYGLGTKVRLTRAKGLSATGSLSQVLVRIVGRSVDLASFETTVDAIEVI